MEYNTAVVAAAILLVVRSEIGRPLARLLRRVKAVRVWVVSIEFEPDSDPKAGSGPGE